MKIQNIKKLFLMTLLSLALVESKSGNSIENLFRGQKLGCKFNLDALDAKYLPDFLGKFYENNSFINALIIDAAWIGGGDYLADVVANGKPFNLGLNKIRRSKQVGDHLEDSYILPNLTNIAKKTGMHSFGRVVCGIFRNRFAGSRLNNPYVKFFATLFGRLLTTGLPIFQATDRKKDYLEGYDLSKSFVAGLLIEFGRMNNQ